MAKAIEKEVEATEATNEVQDMNRTVKIRLFKDNGQYKEDLFVSVNGRNFQIQRGVEVDVPWYVAEVIENSLSADREAGERLELVLKEMQPPK